MRKILIAITGILFAFSGVACASPETGNGGLDLMARTMKITVNGRVLNATMADNSSAEALLERLEEAPITIEMEDYASMEKVGDLGFSLPRNDRPTDTEAGDLILYQGHNFVIYYNANSWNFTRLGRIEGVSASGLRTVLGRGDVTVTLSIGEEE